MRILVLMVPRMAVQLARRAVPELRGKPVAVVEEAHGAELVAVVSTEATAAGIERGMALDDARSRCPGLVAVPGRVSEELRELERMAAVLRAKATPRVAVFSREAVVVELGGLAQRFADERVAGEAILGVARQWMGLDVRGAIADSAEEAAIAARAAGQRVVVCDPRGATAPVPRREGLAVRGGGAPRPGRFAGALERLGQVLVAHGASCRSLEVTAWTGERVARWRLQGERPLHWGHELVALARPLVEAIDQADRFEVRVGELGPTVEPVPWRRPPGRAKSAPGRALPAQRGLAMAS